MRSPCGLPSFGWRDCGGYRVLALRTRRSKEVLIGVGNEVDRERLEDFLAARGLGGPPGRAGRERSRFGKRVVGDQRVDASGRRPGTIARAVTRLEKRMENGGKRINWTNCLHRWLELPWAEMIVAVFCFHFTLEMPSIVARIVLAILGVILLAKAIADIIEKRTSTQS